MIWIALLIAAVAFGALAVRIAQNLYAGETAKGWPRVPRLAYSIGGAVIGAAFVVGTILAIVFVVALMVI